jgi:predicted O-methyltransferase YrrM
VTDYLTAPAASLTQAERVFLKEAAERVALRFGKSALFVNIGVGLGGSVWCLRAGAHTAQIIGIDIDPDSDASGCEFWHADSRRCADRVTEPIHLLFIDGNHEYHGVKADILAWVPKVAPGGLIAFHDYQINEHIQPMTQGVKRAVDEYVSADLWHCAHRVDSIKSFQRLEV